VIERCNGDIWFQRERVSHRAFFRTMLPAAEAPKDLPRAIVAAPEGERPEFYDFDIFLWSAVSHELDDRPLAELSYTIFDTETTGLQPSQGDEIIQIGATRIVNRRLLRQECFDQLVDPRRSLSQQSVAIHGITPELLVGQPYIDAVLPKFHAFCADTVLVGHNAAFDMRFLQMKEKQTGVRFEQPVLDTLLLSAVLHPNQTHASPGSHRRTPRGIGLRTPHGTRRRHRDRRSFPEDAALACRDGHQDVAAGARSQSENLPCPAQVLNRRARVAPFSPYVALRHLVRAQPLTIAPGASVRETLLLLDRMRADAVVVIDADSRVPLGIVTLPDVVRRIAIEACDLQAPIATVMTSGLITVPADGTAHQASVVMVRRGVRHLVLTEADGSYFNLVSQTDLYTLPGAQHTDLVQSILAARDRRTLVVLAGDVRAFVSRLVAERVSADALCHRISALNDLLTLQVIELVASQFDLPYVPWCWLVFGSEGRLEQTLATDQDNGLIFAADSDDEASGLREAFLPFARAVNEALDACGFPCARATSWPATRSGVCPSTSGEQLSPAGWTPRNPRRCSILASFSICAALYGQESLVNDCASWLLSRASSYPIFSACDGREHDELGVATQLVERFSLRSGQGVSAHHRSEEARLAALRRRRADLRAGRADTRYQYGRASAHQRRADRHGRRRTGGAD
jgi:DNA polymerase III epsilon subunit-like protein/CBS domain-containing protein